MNMISITSPWSSEDKFMDIEDLALIEALSAVLDVLK